MKKSTITLVSISVFVLFLSSCKQNKQQDSSDGTQSQQALQQDTKPATPSANSVKINGRDVKGTLIIDTSENQNGPVVTDGDTNRIEGKNIEMLRVAATKWNHEAIGIIPVTDGYDNLEKATEDMIKGNGDSFETIEKGTNCLFYHCKIKAYDGKDLYGFIVFVKGKNKSYELYCDGNYMSPSPEIASGFVEEKDDAMKVYKMAQTFQPAE